MGLPPKIHFEDASFVKKSSHADIRTKIKSVDFFGQLFKNKIDAGMTA